MWPSEDSASPLFWVVSEALGYASVAFTMDVYSHLLPTMQEQAGPRSKRCSV
jgi:hypothetical protein